MGRGRHGGRSGWVEYGRYLVRLRSRSSQPLKHEVVRPCLVLAGRALEPTERASEPAGRALEPAGRALGPARRALDPAGRPGAIWEGQLRGRRGGRRKEKEKKIEIRERYQYVLVP